MTEKGILQFWIEHNKSSTYSKKLNALFKTAVKLVQEHTHIGKPTDIDKIRIKIIKEYLMIYELTETKIYKLSIWDGRQNPEKLKQIMK